MSPAYAKRFQRADETEEQYVERLRQELEVKFLELGPDTVIGCQYTLSNSFHVSDRCRSCRRDRGWCYHRSSWSTEGVFCGDEIGM